MDFESAFPSVVHNKLWYKLFKQGVSSRFIRISKNFYEQASIAIRLRGDVSNEVEVTRGVLQGDTLSPLFFSLFISDLEDFLQDQGARGVSIDELNEIILLAYADDIVVLAYSFSDMQGKIKLLHKYCKENDLKINYNKSKIIVFQKGGRQKKYSFGYENHNIEVVKDYVYLGTQFSKSGTFRATADRAVSAAKVASGSVLKILERSKSDMWVTKDKLFDTMVRCVAVYGAEVWGLRYLDSLERVQTCFFKRVLSLPVNTPDYAVRLEAGRVSISYFVLKSTLRWLEKINNMPENRYPRVCCNRIFKLAKLKGKSILKYNWALQIESMLDEVDSIKNVNVLDVNILVGNTRKIIEAYELSLRAKDRERLEGSSSLQIYPHLPTEEKNKYYLSAGLPMVMNRLIGQIRLAQTRRHVIKYKKERFVIDPTVKCSVCNLDENETMFHILAECPLYRGLRISTFGDLDAKFSEGRLWMDLLTSSERGKLRVFANFVLKALRARAILV